MTGAFIFKRSMQKQKSDLLRIIDVLTRWAAWGILFGLLALTVVPAEVRPILVRGHYTEHLLAFTSLGMAFATAYRNQTTILLAGLAGFTALIEALQLLLPTRHARWQDLIVDLFAVCAGVAVTRLVQKARSLRQA